MNKLWLVIFVCLYMAACSEKNTEVLGGHLLAEQEAKEGRNAEHYQVQEDAARSHKDK